MPQILALIIILSLIGYGTYRVYDLLQYPSRYAELKEEYEEVVRENEKLLERNEILQAQVKDQQQGFRSLYEQDR